MYIVCKFWSVKLVVYFSYAICPIISLKHFIVERVVAECSLAAIVHGFNLPQEEQLA